MRAGRLKDALEQVQLSVMFSPLQDTHPYLNSQIAKYLSEPERKAIQEGYREAIDRGYATADSLGGFYEITGHYSDEARFYAEAADGQQNDEDRARFLIAAGEAYAKAGKLQEAEQAFQSVIALTPEDERPYGDLLAQVYGPEKNMKGAQTAIDTGLRKRWLMPCSSIVRWRVRRANPVIVRWRKRRCATSRKMSRLSRT